MTIVTRLLTQKNNSNSNDFNNLASALHQMECGTTLEIFAAQREVRLVEQRLLKIINMSASISTAGYHIVRVMSCSSAMRRMLRIA